MMTAAKAATSSPYADGVQTTALAGQANLRARGYKVRIGTGTVAARIADSKAWGANIHVALHSNAPGGSYTCSSTSASGKGTMVMWASSSGKTLATKIKDSVGPKSPGSKDWICKDSDKSCIGKSLGELHSTSAVAAYAEVDYHTWNKGVDWINTSHKQWGWRVAMGVDLYLGYPRK